MERAAEESRWRARMHEQALRFHLVFDVALAVAATAVLKMDGPYYADALAAGLFVCGFGVSIAALRSVRRSLQDLEALDRHRLEMERTAGLVPLPAARRSGSFAAVFALLAIFHLSAASTAVWFTYLAHQDQAVTEGEDIARN